MMSAQQLLVLEILLKQEKCIINKNYIYFTCVVGDFTSVSACLTSAFTPEIFLKVISTQGMDFSQTCVSKAVCC